MSKVQNHTALGGGTFVVDFIVNVKGDNKHFVCRRGLSIVFTYLPNHAPELLLQPPGKMSRQCRSEREDAWTRFLTRGG